MTVSLLARVKVSFLQETVIFGKAELCPVKVEGVKEKSGICAEHCTIAANSKTMMVDLMSKWFGFSVYKSIKKKQTHMKIKMKNTEFSLIAKVFSQK